MDLDPFTTPGRDRWITVACRPGARAAIAARVLDAAGFDVRLLAAGDQVGWPDRFARLGGARSTGT